MAPVSRLWGVLGQSRASYIYMYIALQQMAPVRRLSGGLGPSGKSSELDYMYIYI